ncbi:MAG: hypothetical protein ABFD79_17845 [Phycisphaerales bacterium]
MKQDLALRLLSEIMGWDTEQARKEFEWLDLVSKLKYDHYRGFIAGARFLESLADWLQQFKKEDRKAAYEFISKKLIYISTAEINHLVRLTYPKYILKSIYKKIVQQEGRPLYQIQRSYLKNKYKRFLRETLFLGLSDGAQIDVLRRCTSGIISNEQFFVAYQIHEDKWNTLLADLRKVTNDPQARFSSVYLIDDFVGSGKTFLRKEKDEWKGKLVKFWDSAKVIQSTHFQQNWKLYVHHYLAFNNAIEAINTTQDEFIKEHDNYTKADFSFSMVLPESICIAPNCEFYNIIQKYYDSDIENEHADIGGQGFKMGFSSCALPLVLEHNTPNNSVALLWAESQLSSANHKMRPLFRRRERHTKELFA